MNEISVTAPTAQDVQLAKMRATVAALLRAALQLEETIEQIEAERETQRLPFVVGEAP